jgi:uncharacterized protein (DUF1330 family)
MVYAYVTFTMTDPDALAAYREKAGAAMARFGGEAVVSTKEVTVLEGTPHIPGIAVLLGFPDKESAFAWARSPETQEVHELRRKAGKSDILLLG